MSDFDDFADELDELQKTAENLDGQQIPFDELFPQSFMQRYTDAENIDVFFDRSSWDIQDQEDFEAISEIELDRYVDQHSQFRTWEQMKSKAGEQWVKRQFNV